MVRWSELGSDGWRRDGLVCLEPAGFVGTIAEGLPLAGPAAAEGNRRFAGRQGPRLAKVVNDLHLDPRVKGYHQGAIFPATDGYGGAHRVSFVEI